MTNNSYTMSLEGGKYTVIHDYTGAGLSFLRHGEAWPVVDDLKYSKVVGAMASRIEELEMAIGQVINGSLDERGNRRLDGMANAPCDPRTAVALAPYQNDWQDRLQAVLEQRS